MPATRQPSAAAGGPADGQERAIVSELKRITSLMLCGEMPVAQFRAERRLLLERFQAGRRWPPAARTANNSQEPERREAMPESLRCEVSS